MKSNQSSASRQLSTSTYIAIGVIGFLLTLFCVYYYLQYIEGSVTEKQSQKVFYLILILFGIAASALVFGAMKSYGELSGNKLDTKFQFAGPVVGVILVVLGGFYLPHGDSNQTLAIRIEDDEQLPITAGKVTLYFARYTREQTIDNKGLAVFSDIKEEDLEGKIRIDVVSDGYKRLTLDTAIKGFSPIQLSIAPDRTVHISGQVTDADDKPIKDVVLMVEGTRFYCKTVNNGRYSLTLADYSMADELTLVTSHKDYGDKTRTLKIERPDMANIDFVLQPLGSVHQSNNEP